MYLVERGWIVSVANLRGGGEFGKKWHEAGTGNKKQNTFDDFNAGGQHLIDEGYTSSKHLAGIGFSNGGLTVTATMTQQPDLFAAIVSFAGLHDMLNYTNSGNGKKWTGEYGDPINNEADFHNIFKYSPYQVVARKPAKNYPSALFLSGVEDKRVVPMHTFKMFAALQAKQGNCKKPVLFYPQRKAGHGGSGKKTAQHMKYAAMIQFLQKVIPQQ